MHYIKIFEAAPNPYAAHTTPHRALQNAVNEYIRHHTGPTTIRVTVSIDEPWCIFEGIVDSQWTRAALFSLAPSRHGRRFIIDKLHVSPHSLAEGDSP